MTMTFGGYLMRARYAGKLSMREVARQLGITPVYLAEMENGTRNPSRKYARQWAEIVGADPNVAERLAMPDEVRALHEEIERLREALAFYADPVVWEPYVSMETEGTEIVMSDLDRGHTARAALREVLNG